MKIFLRTAAVMAFLYVITGCSSSGSVSIGSTYDVSIEEAINEVDTTFQIYEQSLQCYRNDYFGRGCLLGYDGYPVTGNYINNQFEVTVIYHINTLVNLDYTSYKTEERGFRVRDKQSNYTYEFIMKTITHVASNAFTSAVLDPQQENFYVRVYEDNSSIAEELTNGYNWNAEYEYHKYDVHNAIQMLHNLHNSGYIGYGY